MRTKCTLLTVVVMLSSTFVVTASPAEGTDGTPCTGEVDLTVDPGLSTSPTSGTWTTHGETGTFTCRGTVNGYDVTGPGTFGGYGHYGSKHPDTCSGGEADGLHLISIPTSAGVQHVTNNHTATYGPLEGGGIFGGEFTGPRFSGTFQARPVEGDCLSAPLTKVHFSVNGTLRS